MQFTPRPYQTEAIKAAVDFFQSPVGGNGIEILPTGSGKSVVIANIAKELQGQTVVFQPSKEILEQNYKKFTSYGYRAGIYSASAGSKRVEQITFATIGSVAKKHHIFANVKNVIVDECHLCNAKGGMYKDFFAYLSQAKILGLTATPYRLTNSLEGGAMLKFLTRTSEKIFSKVLYYVQNDVLFNAGHLAKLEYFDVDGIDRSRLMTNSSGSEFSEQAIRNYSRHTDLATKIASYAIRVLAKRKNLLVFCNSIEEAHQVARKVPGAVVLTGDTEKTQREKILAQFTGGVIRCVVNVGVLTTGFDYPELEAVLIGISTMSLALYYQIVGRVMRPHPDKVSGWVVDMGGNVKMFGEIETMKIEQTKTGLYYISNKGRQLTNVSLEKI